MAGPGPGFAWSTGGAGAAAGVADAGGKSITTFARGFAPGGPGIGIVGLVEGRTGAPGGPGIGSQETWSLPQRHCRNPQTRLETKV